VQKLTPTKNNPSTAPGTLMPLRGVDHHVDFGSNRQTLFSALFAAEQRDTSSVGTT
jgi:hypothetical protein